MSTQPPPLRFTGHKNLVNRLILPTLTGRAILISSIRPASPSHPGLAPHEVSLLRLLESITNGPQIEFSLTGTTLLYRPGLLTGSLAGGYGAAPIAGGGAGAGMVTHELPANCARGVAFFLLPLVVLAPFAKAPVNVLFTGPGVITSATEAGDISVDTVRTAILPLLARFGISRNIEVRVLRRSGAGPGSRGGAGEVQVVLGAQVRLPGTLHLLGPGRVKRIRGVAYSTGVAGANNARMIEAARGVLNAFVADTYIFSDVSSAPYLPSLDKAEPGKKRKIGVGFGISLVAESSTDCLYSADVASPASGGRPAEDVGRECAYQLLEAIERGGCVERLAAPTVLMLMAMGSEDVGRLQLGREVLGTEEVLGLARDVRAFGGSGWGMRDVKEGGEGDVVVSVVGKGVGNVGRKIA